MKYAKILGLLALAATALMALSATASATEITSPPGTIYTGKIVAEAEGHATLHGPSGSGIKIECGSSVEGTVEQHGSGVTVKGNIAALSFTGCTNGWTVNVLAKGSLEAHASTPGTAGNGTLTSSGTEVTTVNGAVHCIYKTSNTSIGTLTGSASNATLDISAAIPRTGGSSGIFCGSTGTWTGSYKVTSPTNAWVS